MNKINKHIEIVRSNKIWLSAMSQKSCDAILVVLSKHFTSVGVATVNDFADLEALAITKPDLVFLGMKFVPMNPSLGLKDPEKIWVSDYLGQRGIPCTGSNQLANELERDKPMAKQRIIDANLATSAYFVVKQGQDLIEDDISLTFPLFVKPINRGGGLGIDSASVVRNIQQLRAKVKSIANELKTDSLVEQYLTGREFSVAILQDELSDEYLVMPLEKIAPQDENGERLLSGQIKSADSVRDAEVTDQDIKMSINSLAINVFHALGARDYGRIDVRLDDSGSPQFLEANLIPSLIRGYGSFPKSCLLNMDLDHEPMILRIVNLAFSRSNDICGDETESIMATDDNFVMADKNIVAKA